MVHIWDYHGGKRQKKKNESICKFGKLLNLLWYIFYSQFGLQKLKICLLKCDWIDFSFINNCLYILKKYIIVHFLKKQYHIVYSDVKIVKRNVFLVCDSLFLIKSLRSGPWIFFLTQIFWHRRFMTSRVIGPYNHLCSTGFYCLLSWESFQGFNELIF